SAEGFGGFAFRLATVSPVAEPSDAPGTSSDDELDTQAPILLAALAPGLPAAVQAASSSSAGLPEDEIEASTSILASASSDLVEEEDVLLALGLGDEPP